MPTPLIEVWFEFASTYSYPALLRIEPAAHSAGVSLRYRPFLLGPIFASQGWSDSPFNIYESKGRYMWRDLARICEREGLPFHKPSVFPRNGLLAARVSFAATDQPWLPAFVRSVYTANFAHDRDISDSAVISELLCDQQQDAGAWIARAATPEVKNGLRAQTERAVGHGIFGAPSFLVGEELFWGNDRLEEALAWAVSHR